MPDQKRLLIVTYYWPPSGGSGVQRWLKFVKYLPQFGWHPYIFTPENPAFAIQDDSLLGDVPKEAVVIRYPIWEPYELFLNLSRLFGRKKTAKPTALVSAGRKSFFENVATWVRGNVFIPDPRVFWVRPAVKYLHQFLADNDIDTVITTGPPHSMHLIGLALKRKNSRIRWLADFRDPWSEWGLLDSLMTGRWPRKLHRRLEAKVLAYADDIITITPFFVRRFELLSQRKVELLPNGFDEADFSKFEYQRSAKFIMRHIGIVNERCNPRPLMQVIEQLALQRPDFANQVEIEFVGEVHPDFREFVERSGVLKRITFFRGNIPHGELMKLYGTSSLLLLILTGYKDAAGYMPGKLFEYMATGLPTLGVGPVAGDAAALLQETQSGVMLDGTDASGIRAALLNYFEGWLSNPGVTNKSQAAKKYSRRAITDRLVKLLSNKNNA